MSDPVHHLRVPMRLYDGPVEQPGWYFWTDGAGHRVGPYSTEAFAREALTRWEDGL